MAVALLRSNLMICEGTGCAASQAHDIRAALNAEIKRRGLDGEVRIVQTGCRGFCAMGPVVMIYPEGIFYCQVQAGAMCRSWSRRRWSRAASVERLAYQEPLDAQGHPALQRHPLLQQADAHRAAQLRHDRPGETSTSTSPATATRPWARC